MALEKLGPCLPVNLRNVIVEDKNEKTIGELAVATLYILATHLSQMPGNGLLE